jgi:hypothetical protein
MKRLITNFLSARNGLKLMVLLATGLFSGQLNAQTQNSLPYCKPTFNSMSTGSCTNNYGFRFLNIEFENIYADLSACYGSSTNDMYRYFPGKSTTVTAGAKYKATCQTGFYTASPTNYPMAVGAWIDYNRNGTFETGEWIRGTSQVLPTNSIGAIHTWEFTVPCNISPGVSRVRFLCQYSTAVPNSGYCNGYSYGECIDFDVQLNLPTSVSANFVAPTDAWVKTVVKFINSNQVGYIEHAWDANNDMVYDQVGPKPDYSNPQFLWKTPGNKCVKLRSTNCLGSDSIVKCVNVKTPTAVPVGDFVADKVQIEKYQEVKLYDLSTNGPYEWVWDVYDSTTYASQDWYPSLASNEVQADPNSNGNDELSQNPEFFFLVPGCYTVVLTSKNDVGPSAAKKKICYITVTPETTYILGLATYGPNLDNIVGSATGTIMDKGGDKLPYEPNEGLGTRSYLQITPCNAKKITLTMSQLKFKDAGDVLRVWDGKSPGGPGTTLLASWSVNAKAPQTVVATSGSMYILFESDAGGVDSGYIGTYTSELGPATVPTPAFVTNTVPSYNATPVKFTNTTQNIVGVPTWEWTVDGSQMNANTNKDFNYTFTSDGTYDVCVTMKSCVGEKTTCKSISVITPNQQTTLDLKASQRRPNVGVDQTVLTPISDNANRFEYTIFPTTYTLVNPPSSPSTYGPGFIKYGANPGDSIPTPILKFNSAGCYTITLKAWNSLDQTNTVKTIVKNKFICALDYCVPNSYILSSDVGINRVRLMDGTTELINNYSTSGEAAYTDFTEMQKATLTYGKSYTLEVSRTTSVDPANRKAWIDWNIDGDFDDQDEELFFEASTTNQVYTTTITVPALSSSFEGVTRMRIASNYNNESTTSCGPLTAGEYEDYAIELTNDYQIPVITLNGKDTVRIEVGSSYTDAGATAWDASEGDITGDIITTDDLETTVTGLYQFEYNVTDKSGNPANPVIRTVIVVNDLTDPVLTLNPGNTGCITARRDNGPYVEPGATATDNKAPFNLTSSVIIKGSVNTRQVGNYTITYEVQDVAGNKVVKTRNVCVVDDEKPMINALGDTSIQIGSVWLDQTNATDDYDLSPVLTKDWGFNGPVNTLNRRTYPVTYYAVDSTGNQAVPVVRNYRVDDFIPPVINLGTFDIVEHDVRTTYNSVFPTVTDNYYSFAKGEVSLRLVSSNVNTGVLGTYQEVYEAIDGSLNKTTKIRTIKVVDRVAPRIWGEIIHGCVGENIWPMWGLALTDNYYGPQDLMPRVEIVNQNVNIWEEGIYTITYRVTDPSGNTSDEFTRLVYFTYWPKCFNSTVSVDDIKTAEEMVNIYPNPSTGIFNIDLQGALAQNATVEVYNAMGQLVVSNTYSDINSKFEVNLSGYSAGVYTIKLKVDGEVVTKRVILQ